MAHALRWLIGRSQRVDDRVREHIRGDWVSPRGDRRQELVFIGIALDESGVRAKLDAALLTAAELAAGRRCGRHCPTHSHAGPTEAMTPDDADIAGPLESAEVAPFMVP